MNAGIQIINDHGTILIDDKSPCLQLRAKYTLNVRSGAAPGIDNISIPNVQAPLFAIRPHVAGKRVYIANVAATATPTTKLLQLRQTLGVGWDESSSVNVDIYHFDKPLPPTSNTGLQVFDAAGNCTFDAMGKTAVVVGVADAPVAPIVVTPPSGRVYAFASPAPYKRFFMENDSGTNYNNHYGNLGAILANGAVWMMPAGEVIYGTEPGSGPDIDIHYYGTPMMLAIDVTGY
jgi:hypothetical protein